MLTEGYYIDNAIALRIIWLLTKPFVKWPAYQDGIIDIDGKKIRNAKTAKERDDWTMLHRLVARLKRIIGIVPGGKSFLGTLTASYLLMRECAQTNQFEISEEELFEKFMHLQENIDPAHIHHVEKLMEDVASTSLSAGSMQPLSVTNPPFAGGPGSPTIGNGQIVRRKPLETDYKSRNLKTVLKKI